MFSSQQGCISSFGLFQQIVWNFLIFSNNQTGEVNTELDDPILITVKDNFNNIIPNVAVHFETDTNNGSFEYEYVYTNSEGIASNNWNQLFYFWCKGYSSLFLCGRINSQQSFVNHLLIFTENGCFDKNVWNKPLVSLTYLVFFLLYLRCEAV